MNVSIYDIQSGRIVRRVMCKPERAAFQCGPGEGFVLQSLDPAAYCIVNGKPQALRQIEPTIEGRTIGNLPRPCFVTIEGRRYEVDDGTAELDFAYPGPYVVRIEADGYKSTTVTIE